MFELVHGSAPNIAGQGVANPVGQMCAAAMNARAGGHGGSHRRLHLQRLGLHLSAAHLRHPAIAEEFTARLAAAVPAVAAGTIAKDMLCFVLGS